MFKERIKEKMNQIPEENLRYGLYYILKHTTGYVGVLEEIHKDLPDYLKRIGYIAYGVDAAAYVRYQTTKEGLEHARINYIAKCIRSITDTE